MGNKAIETHLAALRRKLRARRHTLRPAQQQYAALSVAHLAKTQPFFLRSKRIAFYYPHDGEIDPTPLLCLAYKMRKLCYLPVLMPGKHLCFAPYHGRHALRTNRLGMQEPSNKKQLISPYQLDLVFTPLVAFDRQGGRCGRGGGFYDRSFARSRKSRRPVGPLRVGMAHAFQEQPHLPKRHWDVSLAAVITECAVLWCST